ncbi:MAG: hypothetical protein WDA26_07115 [Pusillimonas sp.]
MTSLIEQLLSTEEGKTLEFKRDLSSPRNILKTYDWRDFRRTTRAYLEHH